MKRFAGLTAAILTLVRCAATQAAVVFTDDFTTGTASYTLPSAGSVVPKATALPNGFFRTLSPGAASFDIDGLDSLTARVFTGSSGFFDYSSSAGASSTSILSYGTSGTPITVSPNDGVRLNFAAVNAPASGFTLVHVILNPGDSSTGTPDGYDSATYAVSKGGAQTFDIPLTVGSDIPVTSFQVFFDAPSGNDFRLNDLSIQPVPEPAALGLLVVGALALRRRPPG